MSALTANVDTPPAAVGLLQRALSLRQTNTPVKPVEFDNKRLLPHISEASVHEDVAASSPRALSSAIEKSKRMGEGEAQTAAAAASASPEVDDDDDDMPPPMRGIRSHGASHSCGSYTNLNESQVAKPASTWKPNMELSLDDFDPNTVRYLAEGAMCQCFLASSPPNVMRLEAKIRTNAEKEGIVIKTPIDGGPASAENDLMIESLVLRELSHPNIVSILGGGTTLTGTSFIVLEFLGGGTLRSRLDSCGGGLGIKPAVKYGHQLASALAYMHDEAVPGMILMHRDLKPDNIGFTTDGMVKLMDFGLGKVINRTLRSRSVKYNMTGETGSPRYMPPEVALSRPYNEKADVWSFTIILWEMVTGRLPFAGQNMTMYLERVCNGVERPLVVHTWPTDLKRVLTSGWQADPDTRFSFREIDTILKDLHDELEASKSAKKGFFARG